jgi:hypothetical protein
MADVVQRIRAAASAASAAPAPPRRAGLDSLDELDAHLSASGARVEHLPPLERAPATDGPTVGDYLDELVDGVYSWTWDLPPDQLRAAVEEVRQWVADEHGDPARLPVPFQPIRWHRYVLDPGGA